MRRMEALLSLLRIHARYAFHIRCFYVRRSFVRPFDAYPCPSGLGRHG